MYVSACICVFLYAEKSGLGFKQKLFPNKYIIIQLNIKGNEKSSLALLLVMKEFTWDYANDM